MSDDFNKGKGKSPSQINEDMIGGKTDLPTNKENQIDPKKTIEDRNAIKKDSAVKGVTEQKSGKTTRVPEIDSKGRTEYYQNNKSKPPEPPKMTKTPTPSTVKNVQAMKGVVKAVGAVGKKLISPVAKIITVKEVYDYGKEFKEQIIDKPPVYEQLKETIPENVPSPPKLEVPTDKENNFSNFSSEDKQNFMMAMNEPETQRPAFLEDFKMDIALPDMDVAEPAFDGEDASDGDGADGGDGGGDGGGE